MVINTLNRCHSLSQTLASLELQTYARFEVVVVEGPSTDDTAVVLDRYADRIKRVHVDEANLAMSRNVGIRAASGELIAFIDDDAVADPAWLSSLAPLFSNPHLAAVGGPVMDGTGVTVQALVSATNALGETKLLTSTAALPSSPDSTWMLYPMGTNVVFRRSALVEIGGFDETFEYYHDETDVCRRLLDLGFEVQIAAKGVVHHGALAGEIRLASGMLTTRRSIVKNTAYFALRHGPVRHLYTEIVRSLTAMLDSELLLHRHCEIAGLLADGDMERHVRETDSAMDAAFAAAANPPRTHPPSWFTIITNFQKAFTAGSTETRQHMVLVSSPAESYVSRTTDLAVRGHTVRVLIKGEIHRVELRDRVWIHHLPVSGEVCREQWRSAVASELIRIASIEPVDVVIGISAGSGHPDNTRMLSLTHEITNK